MLESNDIIYVAPLRKRFYAVNSIDNQKSKKVALILKKVCWKFDTMPTLSIRVAISTHKKL